MQAPRALVLPGVAYTEKRATYVNTEGRVQRTEMAVCSPGSAREDWLIISMLAKQLGYDLGCDSVFDVWKALEEVGPQFSEENVGSLVKEAWLPPGNIKAYPPLKGEFTAEKRNFYRP